MICKVCHGTGKQTITEIKGDVSGLKELPDGGVEIQVSETGEEGQSCEISCIWCKGSGDMTEKQSQELEDYQNAWCTCAHSSGSHYYHHANGAHGWRCNDCGKITQAG